MALCAHLDIRGLYQILPHSESKKRHASAYKPCSEIDTGHFLQFCGRGLSKLAFVWLQASMHRMVIAVE